MDETKAIQFEDKWLKEEFERIKKLPQAARIIALKDYYNKVDIVENKESYMVYYV